MESEKFRRFFRRATGKDPYPYQVRLAVEDPLPDILHLPTGSGKTYAVTAAWLWRRKYGKSECFPRRLVYCLPVRVLVEQTYGVIKEFVENSGFSDIGVYKLLGGEVEEEWRYYPESEAVIIGTQDMLLSRALNRGFALSRFSWPLDFAFLNNDCLWVFDEVQLMGSGLATSAQLEAFRKCFGVWGECRTIWLSATLDVDWLRTVDFRSRVDNLVRAELLEDDLKFAVLSKRMHAGKILRSYGEDGSRKNLAQLLKSKHRQGTITLAVLNTVERAVELYKSLKKSYKGSEAKPEIILIHSRFRGAEREEKTRAIVDRSIPPEGRIIVSTQVVEAGVDISSAFLFTELAPWPSIVQRLGRCNRYGEYEEAEVLWIDLDEKEYPPYEKHEMEQARDLLSQFENRSLSPFCLRDVQYRSDPNYRFIIRRKDIVELYDNTPDLTGHDIDVSRFIRDVEALDLQVFWRDFQEQPSQDMPTPSHRELCPVPFYDFRAWLKNAQKEGKNIKAYTWDHLEGKWAVETADALWPGMLILLPSEAGGYDPELGWYAKSRDAVVDISKGMAEEKPFECTSSDYYRKEVWVTLSEHSKNVKDTMAQITKCLSDILGPVNGGEKKNQDPVAALFEAAFLHDVGKVSPYFQGAFVEKPENGIVEPWAKGKMRGGRQPYGRKYFRHELVSALLVLLNRNVLGGWASSEKMLNLVAYLVAAHHGKVRCAIRALPGEDSPGGGRRFALGVWEGDVVDGLELGDYFFPPTELRLECMELGIDDHGEKSWVERCAELLEEFGPFRLAYLEALLRCADGRASEAEELNDPARNSQTGP